jgi:hypothetical protein
LQVELDAVVDCRDAARLGVAPDDLIRDDDFAVPRAIAVAARRRAIEAMLVPSASSTGENLIVFPDLIRAASSLVVARHVDPKLDVAGSAASE